MSLKQYMENIDCGYLLLTMNNERLLKNLQKNMIKLVNQKMKKKKKIMKKK